MTKPKQIIGITSLIIVLGIICTLFIIHDTKQTKLKEEARIAENLRKVEESRLRDEKRKAEREERRKQTEAKAAKIKAEADAEWATLKSKYDCNGSNCLSVCSYSQMEKWVAGNDSYENCKYVYYRTGTYKNLYHKELSLRAFRRGQNGR